MRHSLRVTGLVGVAIAAATLVPAAAADAAAPHTPKAAAAMAERYVNDIGNRDYGDMWAILAPAQKRKITEVQLIECESAVLAPYVETYSWQKLVSTKKSTATIPLIGRKPIVQVTGYVAVKTTQSSKTVHGDTNPPIDAVYLGGGWHWYLDSTGVASCESQ